jgi:hypothetical protein
MRRIIGFYLIDVAPQELDVKEATDLVGDYSFQTKGGVRIAARIRSYEKYFRSYPHDVTFRLWRDSGARTEWEKIFKDGHGDWFWYGFGDEHGAVQDWHLLNLHGMRRHIEEFRYVDHSNRNPRTGKPDGTYLRVYNVHDEIERRPNCLIAGNCDTCNNSWRCRTCGKWTRIIFSWQCDNDECEATNWERCPK